MQTLHLLPHDILIPDLEVGRPDIVQDYVKKIRQQHPIDPIIVANKTQIEPTWYTAEIGELRAYMPENMLRLHEKSMQRHTRRILRHPANYLLFDGNHRSVAFTLAQQPIPALQLETEEDFAFAKEHAWVLGEHAKITTLQELVHSFFSHTYSYTYLRSTSVMALTDRMPIYEQLKA
ncbi:MAG: hypothetical protein Q7R96_03920 [Nanoarchaeota archaeon]|nr:hypothetical protein [Nanoarchaeota archaeon]